MDIEKLSKSQIVLLTLLVSFVTSIATGIVTVSLVEQAPPSITQTVSRIVRETVQSAVPAVLSQGAAAIDSKSGAQAPAAPSLSELIARANRSIVRLYSGASGSQSFLGLGLVLDQQGTILTDYEALGTQSDIVAEFTDGTTTPLSVVTRDTSSDLVYLSPAATTTEQLYPAPIAAVAPSVGDTVIAMAGKSELRIATGLVIASGIGTPSVIETDAPPGSLIKGSPIMNAQGEFVGISTGSSRAVDPSAFIPLSQLPAGNTPTQ